MYEVRCDMVLHFSSPVCAIIFVWPNSVAVGQNQWDPILVGRCTTKISLFQWGLGCSLGVRDFYPSASTEANQCMLPAKCKSMLTRSSPVA